MRRVPYEPPSSVSLGTIFEPIERRGDEFGVRRPPRRARQSLETTQRYMHLSQAASREAIRALESRGTMLAPDESVLRKLNEDAR
jgi:hypothetical protein